MGQIIEYKKTYQEYKAELDEELAKTAEGFVRIGYLLKVARDTSILHESGYISVTDFAKAEYNIDKSQVSRFIHINDKFSEGGYGDCLMNNYIGFGYAKLALMLQLPDEINEEITPDYSKSEIQAIKDEMDAERKITDIDVILEGEAHTTTVMDDDLGKTIKQMGEDDPQLYADIWMGIRQPEWSIKQLQIMLSPAGQKIYSVRIRGVGRKQMIAKDIDNGYEIVLIDLRSSGKKRYTWEDVNRVWQEITLAEPETGFKGAWEVNYLLEWPIKEKVAPVQPPLKEEEKKPIPKKDSKVQKAPTEQKKPIKSEENSMPSSGDVKKDTISNLSGELPGQTEIEKDFINKGITGPVEDKGEENNQIIHGKDNIVEKNQEIVLTTTEEEAQAQWNGYMNLVESSAKSIVKYVEMRSYVEARQELKELNKFISMMEELSEVSRTEEL